MGLRKLKAIEGLFQASRYPSEESNKASVVEGKHKTAFEVAQFLSCAISELKPNLVHKKFYHTCCKNMALSGS